MYKFSERKGKRVRRKGNGKTRKNLKSCWMKIRMKKMRKKELVEKIR
jgi:hypothetical protein